MYIYIHSKIYIFGKMKENNAKKLVLNHSHDPD